MVYVWKRWLEIDCTGCTGMYGCEGVLGLSDCGLMGLPGVVRYRLGINWTVRLLVLCEKKELGLLS